MCAEFLPNISRMPSESLRSPSHKCPLKIGTVYLNSRTFPALIGNYIQFALHSLFIVCQVTGMKFIILNKIHPVSDYNKISFHELDSQLTFYSFFQCNSKDFTINKSDYSDFHRENAYFKMETFETSEISETSNFSFRTKVGFHCDSRPI